MVRCALDTGTRHSGKLGMPTKIIPGTGIPYLTRLFIFIYEVQLYWHTC